MLICPDPELENGPPFLVCGYHNDVGPHKFEIPEVLVPHIYQQYFGRAMTRDTLKSSSLQQSLSVLKELFELDMETGSFWSLESVFDSFVCGVEAYRRLRTKAGERGCTAGRSQDAVVEAMRLQSSSLLRERTVRCSRWSATQSTRSLLVHGYGKFYTKINFYHVGRKSVHRVDPRCVCRYLHRARTSEFAECFATTDIRVQA